MVTCSLLLLSVYISYPCCICIFPFQSTCILCAYIYDFLFYKFSIPNAHQLDVTFVFNGILYDLHCNHFSFVVLCTNGTFYSINSFLFAISVNVIYQLLWFRFIEQNFVLSYLTVFPLFSQNSPTYFKWFTSLFSFEFRNVLLSHGIFLVWKIFFFFFTTIDFTFFQTCIHMVGMYSYDVRKYLISV